MKCDRCFFCTHIGRGIYAEYPVKYCKYQKKYILPFVETQDNGGTARLLDFGNRKDCKIRGAIFIRVGLKRQKESF